MLQNNTSTGLNFVTYATPRSCNPQTLALIRRFAKCDLIDERKTVEVVPLWIGLNNFDMFASAAPLFSIINNLQLKKW